MLRYKMPKDAPVAKEEKKVEAPVKVIKKKSSK